MRVHKVLIALHALCHRYEFRLRAHNAAGFSAWSPTSSLVSTLLVLPPPQPPAPLFAGASLLPSLPAAASSSALENDNAASAAVTVYVTGASSFRGPNGRASNSAVGDSGAGRISSVAPNGQEEEGSPEKCVHDTCVGACLFCFSTSPNTRKRCQETEKRLLRLRCLFSQHTDLSLAARTSLLLHSMLSIYPPFGSSHVGGTLLFLFEGSWCSTKIWRCPECGLTEAKP